MIIAIVSDKDIDTKISKALDNGYHQPIIYTSLDYESNFKVIKGDWDKESVKADLKSRFPGKSIPISFDSEYDIDVVICYTASDYRFLNQSIESILSQVGVNPIIHLVNDGGPSIDYNHDNIIQYVNRDAPIGPYRSVHRIVDSLKSDYIAIQDADDIAVPNRLKLSIEALNKGYDLVSGKMMQFIDSEELLNPKLQKSLKHLPILANKPTKTDSNGSLIHGVTAYRKSFFTKINGYSNWYCGADREFQIRANHQGCKILFLDEILGFRRLHTQSLTKNKKYGFRSNYRNNLDLNNGFGGLQLDRNSKSTYTVNSRNDKVIVGIGSVPRNQQTLELTLRSLFHKQTRPPDEVHIHLDGYDEIPGFLINPGPLLFSSRGKIFVHQTEITGPRGKHYLPEPKTGYRFSCDDDIVYPSDYIERMIKAVDHWDSIVGVHGIILSRPYNDYLKRDHKFNCQESLDVDTRVHILGTGTVAYHTDTINITPADLPIWGLDDPQLGAIAANKGIPMMAVSRPHRWLFVSDLTPKQSLWASIDERKQDAAKIISSVSWPKVSNVNF